MDVPDKIFAFATNDFPITLFATMLANFCSLVCEQSEIRLHCKQEDDWCHSKMEFPVPTKDP